MPCEEIKNIIIIEDNKFIREGWQAVINQQEDFTVTGAYRSCEEAFEDTGKFGEADLVIMDIGLPGVSGIEGVKFLRRKYPDLTIIMCTVYEDEDKIFDALCAGAVGYLSKKTSPDKLIESLREACSGGSPMSPNVARKVIKSFQKTNEIKTPVGVIEKLTEREEQILSLMAQGKTYSEIAENLFLSIDGVYYHIRHIYEKLEVHSRAAAVAEAIKKRLIQPPRK